MNELGVNNFKVELIDEITCCSIKDLFKIEGFYIKQQGTLNKNIAGRSKVERERERASCTCGHYYNLCHRLQHLRSKRHAKYILSNTNIL